MQVLKTTKIRIFIILLGFSVIVGTIIFLFLPQFKFLVSQEDSLVESITVILFATGLFLGILQFMTGKTRRGLCFVSAISMLGLLDELSYGERIFGFREFYIQTSKIDGLHDFLSLFYTTYLSFSFPLRLGALLVLLLVSGALIYLIFRYRLKIANFLHGFEPIMQALVAAACVLVLLAQVVDAGIIRNRYLNFLEEILEMNAALALLIALLPRLKEPKQVFTKSIL